MKYGIWFVKNALIMFVYFVDRVYFIESCMTYNIFIIERQFLSVRCFSSKLEKLIKIGKMIFVLMFSLVLATVLVLLSKKRY